MKLVIYQSRLSLLYLGFGVIGAAFSGALAYLMNKDKWVAAPSTSEVAAHYVGYIILALFIGFSVACVIMTLAVKRLVLTPDSLYINRPLLLINRRITLSDILRLTSKNFQITAPHRHSNFTIHNGKQTTIHLLDGRIVRYNSFEIGNYYTFTASLQNELRRYKAKLNYPRLKRQDRQWRGYAWLLLMAIITGGLLVSLYLQASERH